MNGPYAEESRVIDARPEVLYQIIADYRNGHPKILPKPFFTSLQVEKGGVGSGTVIRVETQVMGTRETLRMVVSEPEPGRVLKEEDPGAGVETTFTVAPVEDGSRTKVTIATRWRAKPGLLGLGERLMKPPVARRLYRQELLLLEEQARKANQERRRR